MKIKYTLFTVLSLFQLTCNSQTMTPIELVEKVFTDKSFIDEIPKYSTGEYEGRPNSSDIIDGVSLTFKSLETKDSTAVINITAESKDGYISDLYVHLNKEEHWKINAFRGLAMTGILEELKNQFESMSDSQIDSLISAGDEDIKSKEDFYYVLNNISLTLKDDNSIVKHFENNRNEFELLAQQIASHSDEENINLNEIYKERIRKLLIGNISSYNLFCEQCIELTIGGMIDNTVGYFYIEDKSKLPEMNPDRIIMIREIGNGWYMFKTT